MRFRRDAIAWTTEQRTAWVLTQLRATLRRAARETSFYRERFAEVGFDPTADFGFEDIGRLPVLERDDVRGAGRSIVSTAIPHEQLVKQATGGSTGVPTEVWLGPEERGWSNAGVDFSLASVGAPPGSGIAMLWGHHLDPGAGQSIRERLRDYEANLRWFDCFRISADLLEIYHQRLERWRPACMVAYASGLAALAEHILERGYSVNYPRTSLVTGAEKLLPRDRSRIHEAFGLHVHERYGSRDVGPIGFQQRPQEMLAFDVDWGNVLVEPESDEKECAILVTKLHADGMPMIRYRVGDVGRFPAGSRPGHPVFSLEEVVGRELDRIWLPDGRWVSGAEIPHLMKDYPVREFAFVQRADYSVEMLIVPSTEFGESSRADILRIVADNVPNVPIRIELVDAIPRTQSNKRRPVTSEIPPPQPTEAR